MINIHTVEKNLTLYPTAIDQVIHPVEAAQQGGLTAATGPDKRRDALFGYITIDAVQCPISAVKQLQGPEAESDFFITRALCPAKILAQGLFTHWLRSLCFRRFVLTLTHVKK